MPSTPRSSWSTGALLRGALLRPVGLLLIAFAAGLYVGEEYVDPWIALLCLTAGTLLAAMEVVLYRRSHPGRRAPS